MEKNTIFTICAKNYLAQALTLQKSVIQHNPNVDFFIVLADALTIETNNLDVCTLDESWCPDWMTMAFKYNVIEFSTSIKPFFISKLLKDGYQKVIYLDPDIYVVNSLNIVFDALDAKSIVLTPHYCDILEQYDGAVSENVFMNGGVFNLGFCAVRNDSIGKEIVGWWMNRLHTKCYAQSTEGLFTDQKWMDFIPAFFPEHCLVSHHFGLNNAIWNLHERSLLVENNNYYIIRKKTQEKYPLIFFHFSGFDPDNEVVINRRHPDHNTNTYPTFKPLIDKYRHLVYENGYEKYHTLQYEYNYFEDGSSITPLHRRLFRRYCEESGYVHENPFSKESPYYNLIKTKRKLLFSKKQIIQKSTYSLKEIRRGHNMEKFIIYPFLKFFYALFGYNRYMLMIKLAQKLSILESHIFLIK